MIVHPVTGEKLDISSTAGRSVFKNYLKYFNTGGSFTNITVPNKNLTGEKLSKFLAELNEGFKKNVGSDVDPTKLKEITGIVTGKIDELKGLITDSNFVSKTELQNITGRLDSLTKLPETTGITEDILNTKLQNYFTNDSVKEFEKQLNQKLNNYFTQDDATALKSELKNSINAKPSPVEPRVSITDEEFKNKLVKTGLFKESEESKESDGIAFNINKLPIDEDKLNQKLKDYELIEGKTEGEDTYTAKIDEIKIREIINEILNNKEIEEKATDTKEPESSGIDEKLRKILLKDEILEKDKDGNLKVEETLKRLIKFFDGPFDKIIKYVSNRSPGLKAGIDLLETKQELEEGIEDLNPEIHNGGASHGDNTETNEDKLMKLKNLLEEINTLENGLDTEDETEIHTLRKELDNIKEKMEEIIDPTFVGGAPPEGSPPRNYKNNNDPVDRLEKPLTEKNMRDIVNNIEGRARETYDNLNKEIKTMDTLIRQNSTKINNNISKIAEKSSDDMILETITKTLNSVTDTYDDTADKIPTITIGDKEQRKNLKISVDKLSALIKKSSKTESGQVTEEIVNSIIDNKTKDIQTKILKSIYNKFSTFNREGGQGISPRDDVINKVTTVLNSLAGLSDARERGSS